MPASRRIHRTGKVASHVARIATELASQFALPTSNATLLGAVDRIGATIQENETSDFELWKRHTARYVDLQTSDQLLATTLPTDSTNCGVATFAFQVYCVAVIEAVGEGVASMLPAPTSFASDRVDAFSSTLLAVGDARSTISDLVHSAIESIDPNTTLDHTDLSEIVAVLYQELAAPEVRHLLGEYYTPPWLVRQTLDLLDSPKGEQHRVFDPAVGSGTFICDAIDRALDAECSRIEVFGADINLVALRAAAVSLAPHKALATRRGCVLAVTLFWADPLLNLPMSQGAPGLFGPAQNLREYELLDGALTSIVGRGIEPRIRRNTGSWLDDLPESLEPLVEQYTSDVLALASLENIDWGWAEGNVQGATRASVAGDAAHDAAGMARSGIRRKDRRIVTLCVRMRRHLWVTRWFDGLRAPTFALHEPSRRARISEVRHVCWQALRARAS